MNALALTACLLAASFLAFPEYLAAKDAAAAIEEEVSFVTFDGVQDVNITSSYEVEGDPMQVVSPALKATPLIRRLAGASALISLINPLPLRHLAIPRVGWDDWAVPDEVTITVNGVNYGAFHLSAPVVHPSSRTVPAAVDIIDLGREVDATRIEVEVLAASAVKGQNRHGTLRVLLPARQ